MSNTFGHVLALTTFGESHGPVICCVIDAFPPGSRKSPSPEISERKRIDEPASIERIIAVVAAALDCNYETIFESVRGRQNLARMLVAHFAHSAGQWT